MMPARSTALLLAAGLLLAGGAAAAERQTVLGKNGEVFAVSAGAYGTLFPQGKGAAAVETVLALDVTRVGAARERLLVPGTSDGEVEAFPSLVYEEASDSLFLVWQSAVNQIHPVLFLSSFKGGEWGEVIEIAGNTFAAKSAPRFAVTRDEYRLDGPDEEARTVRRTVLHLVWWESSGATDRVHYAPILLLDGAYVGSNPIYSLGEFDRAEVEPTLPAVHAELFRAPRVQAGRNPHSVVISFANPATGRLVVLETALLPGELSLLADGIRAHIIEGGLRFTPENLTAFADKLRAHIIEGGSRLHPGVLLFIADRLRAHIIEGGNRYKGAVAAAEGIRAHIIEGGANLLSNQIRNTQSTTTAGKVAELRDPATGAAGPTTDLIQFRVVASRPAPATGAAPTISSSADGKSTLVAWLAGSELHYRESLDKGWSQILRLAIGESLTLEDAWKALERRIQAR